MDTPFLFAVAAGCGAGARYALTLGLTLGMLRLCGSVFPWGTFLCNVLGSLLFGLVWSSAEGSIAPQYRGVLLSGFLGSFTTFSTFIFDAHIFLKEGRRWACALQIISHVLCGIGAFYLGVWL